jgi:ankyrin repeat protein
MSCLFIAAQKGHVEMAKMLAEIGGRELLMLTDSFGQSCLFMAVLQGHVEVVKILEEACKQTGMSQEDISVLKTGPVVTGVGAISSV